jgi:hypothetical protein
MGIGPHAIKLTRIVRDAGLLSEGFSIMELGSQDFAPSLTAAHEAIYREFGFSDPQRIRTPADLYRKIGCSEYSCIDLDGRQGAHVFDLNFSLREKYEFDGEFEFVTNHGTTEHLFNQLVAFRNVHEITKAGGVMLHALPFQGYQNHGMFNYQPSFFLDLSMANDYEVFGLFLSLDDRLFAYDQDFLARNGVTTDRDCLILAVLQKGSRREFGTPYDGRYFSVYGKAEVAALETHVGTTRRSFGAGSYAVEGLDEEGGAGVPLDVMYRFITPVWGTQYVEDFLNITLRSQLSARNLEAFSEERSVYTIVTTPSDEKLIRRSDLFPELERLLAVEFIYHGGRPNEHAYERMTRCYNLALTRVQKSQTCFFLTADDFYSDGVLKTAKEVINAGKRAVMVPTLRVVAESFRSELESRTARALSASELVSIMLRHEHPMITACVVNDQSELLHRLPSQTLYRLQNGYLGRWNVMHPLAIKLPARARQIVSTIDWNYPVLNVSSADDIYILRDSDEGLIASMTSYSYSQDERITKNGTPANRIRCLKEWVDLGWTLNFHLLQMSQPVYIHSGPIESQERDRGLAAVDSIWRPFRDYVERNKTPVPNPARGYSLDLLTTAVQINSSKEVMKLAKAARNGLMRESKRRLVLAMKRLVS